MPSLSWAPHPSDTTAKRKVVASCRYTVINQFVSHPWRSLHFPQNITHHLSLLPRNMEDANPRRGCWDCRKLKIGCDREFPACQNCVQSKRKCSGYGLRLSWPQAADKRRAIVANKQAVLARQRQPLGRRRFLNTSTWDIDLHNEIVRTGDHRGQINSGRLGPWSSQAVPKPMSTPWGVLDVREQVLLSYYERVLSRMMTTIDDDHNGFRHILIKLALSEKSASSEAVLQGILAFSAYHLSESGAGLEYSFAATKSLSASMRISTAPRDKLCQIAASMVLVTYGVR